MRIVVTGGAGFVGSAVCRHLVTERGATVVNLDSQSCASSFGALGAIATNPRYSLRKADIRDKTRVAALLEAFAPDAVIHVAADAHPADANGASASGTDSARVDGTLATCRLLEAAHDYWSRLPASRRDHFRILNAASPRTGSTADLMATAWHQTFGLPVMTAHCTSTYGPFEHPDRLLPRLIIAAIDGTPLPIETDEIHDWVHIDDHICALDLLLARGEPGETYAIASGANRSLHDAARRIAALVDRHPRRQCTARMELVGPAARARPSIAGIGTCPPLDAGSIDVGKFTRATGWRPQIGFEAGVSRTVGWYFDNAAWWAPLRQARAAAAQLGLRNIA